MIGFEFIHSYSFQQLARCPQQLLLTGRHNLFCQLTGILQFSIEIEHVRQLFLGIVVQNVCSGLTGSFVHAHIQGRVETEGESSRLIVKVMTGYAQVGQQSVNLLYTVILHPIADISKVAANEGKSIIVDDIFFCVGILVKTVQMTFRTQARQYLFGMTATTESYVYVNAVGLDIQPVNALLKEYRNVICFCRYDHLFTFHYSLFTSEAFRCSLGACTAINSSRACPKSSGVICCSSVFELLHISMVSPIPINLISCSMAAIR